MTTAQFASYDAIVLGDPYCDPNEDITFLNASKQNWTPAVTGNIILIGSDPSFHSSNGVVGATTFIDDALSFVVSGPTTGLYFALACLYEYQNPYVTVDSLSGFGTFAVVGVANDQYNDIHVVASSIALNGLSDTDLSNWYYSVHNTFISYPADFTALAIANNAVGQGQQTFGDGSQGIPYILARGVTPAACGNGQYESLFGEECDHGNQNGAPGDLCTSACKCKYGVLDSSAGTCRPAPRPTTTAPAPATSSSGTFAQSSSYAVTTAQVVGSTTISSAVVTTSTFTSGGSTSITTISSNTAVVSVYTTSALSTISGGTGTIPQGTISSARPVTGGPPPGSPPPGGPPPGGPPMVSSNMSRPPPTNGFSRPSTRTVSRRPQGYSPTGNSPVASTAPSNPAATHRPHPLTIGTFAFVGCYGSDDNYPGFTLTKSDPLMTLEMCSDACAAHVYAGAYDT